MRGKAQVVTDPASERFDSIQGLDVEEFPEPVSVAVKLSRIRAIQREQGGPRLAYFPKEPVMYESWPAGGGAPVRWMGR
ncbi:hypothetical protein [Nocardia testacea]|uniref:Uncharacterized protein n=1 Tax=Nocardia testacea TaxID=248551 RepID=A0ABW7W295_9NOCA